MGFLAITVRMLIKNSVNIDQVIGEKVDRSHIMVFDRFAMPVHIGKIH
jgi:hypothetical protein